MKTVFFLIHECDYDDYDDTPKNYLFLTLYIEIPAINLVVVREARMNFGSGFFF